MSSPSSAGWESWLATAWNPLLKEPRRRDEVSTLYPYHLAARPLDPRHLPFAIVKNTQMIPALLQNFRDYCDSPSAHRDFTGDPAVFERIEAKKNWIESRTCTDDEADLEYDFPQIVLNLIRLLGQQLVSYVHCHTVETVGVQVSGEWYKRAYDDDGGQGGYDGCRKPSATILCLLNWLTRSKKNDAFQEDLGEEDAAMVDITLDNISQMADNKHVFDYDKSLYVRNEDSLMIRVRSGKAVFLFHLTNPDSAVIGLSCGFSTRSGPFCPHRRSRHDGPPPRQMSTSWRWQFRAILYRDELMHSI
jgi:hypothetical protein